MDARLDAGDGPMATTNRPVVERVSDRELTVARTFDAPARLLFEAWSTAELLKRWWVPKSMGMTLLSCEADVRVSGQYRFVFRHPAAEQPIAFFGKYIEVVPNKRIAWTNEESADGAVTTVTFEEKGGKTLLRVQEVYPSKEALEANAGGMDAMPEQFDQLDELLAALAKRG